MPSNPSKPSDFIVDDASGANVRGDINDIFDSIGRNQGYGSVPTNPLPYMWYANSQTGMMGFYKNPVVAENQNPRLEFISLNDGRLFSSFGSAGNPAFTFNGDSSTGLFRSAATHIGVSNSGTQTATFKPFQLDLAGNFYAQHPTADTNIQISTPTVGKSSYLDLAAHATQYTDYGLRIGRKDGADGASELVHQGTGNFEIITNQASMILFRTNGVNAWFIDSDGKLNWALSGQSGTIPVQSGYLNARGIISRRGINVNAATSNGYNFFWDDVGTDHLELWVDEQHIGDVTTSASDYRIKQNVSSVTDNCIDKVKALKPVNYEYKNYGHIKADGVTRQGFIAHELQEVIPSAVNRAKDVENMLQTINLDSVVSVLTKALQEAVAKIETLEAKVAALEAK